MKIVYCTDSICYLGGIQRITIAKASALANVSGNEVWIIVTDNRKEPVLPLHPKVHLINLNINYFEDDWKGKWYVLKGIAYKRRLHKQKLQIVLNQIQPDIVISTGTSEKNFLPSIHVSSHPAFVREIHNFKYYRIAAANNLFAKILAIGGNFIDYQLRIHRYDKIVVLTEEDRLTNWNGNDKVCVIPNPLTTMCEEKSTCQAKRVIAVGRLSYQKNFDFLIRLWKSLHSLYPDWTLEIWGTGGCQQQLSELIHEFGLQDCVFIKGYTPNVLSEMAKASILAFSSVFEGWGLVIVEAMSVGLPVVAFACPCGPKDIITNNVDGFLIQPGDEEYFREQLIRLMIDENLRIQLGRNALKKSKKYQIEQVAQSWMDLFAHIRPHRENTLA